jgi:hypothetical protein
MALVDQPLEVVSFTTALLLLFLNAYEDLGGPALQLQDVGNNSDDDMNDVIGKEEGVMNIATITASLLHTY